MMIFHSFLYDQRVNHPDLENPIAKALRQQRRQQKRRRLRHHGVLREPREGIHRDGLGPRFRVVETGASVVELALQAIPEG